MRGGFFLAPFSHFLTTEKAAAGIKAIPNRRFFNGLGRC